MGEGSRKTAVVIGAVAAAAGIAVAAVFLVKRRRAQRTPVPRSVADVVSDCYTRIREIQQHLNELTSKPLPSAAR